MNALLHWLSPAGFMPHGYCYLWRPDVLWLNVGSDGVIAASYYAIPLAIGYFVQHRRQVLPYWWVPALFAAFICLCGTTHVLGMWVVWHGDYVAEGLVKLATAVASALTAVMIFRVLPQAMALRTPIELQHEVDARTAELREVNGRLRREIAERQRLEQELNRTVGELEASNRRKDRFLATLAHELRNPLAPIRTGVQILRRCAPQEDVLQRTTQMMERQMGHLVRLVDDLLDVSRIMTGKINLRFENVPVAEVMHAALESVGEAVRQKQLAVTLDLDPRAVVLGDRDRLTEICANLLANAAKFTAEGGAIGVSVRREAQELVVRVRDSGLGIPPEALESIFEMFSQLRPAGYEHGGLGVGLALVRELVLMHGGQVTAHSEGAGCGSEFVVRLPLAEAPSAAISQ